MPRELRPRPPRIDEIVAGELLEGDIADLGAGDRVEGMQYRGGDLSERDLTGVTIGECELVGVSAHDTLLRGAVITETVIERLEAPVLRAPRARRRDVLVAGSRIGSVEFYDNNWQSVRFVGCKLGFVNLRGAELRDIRFTDCTIDELDLGDARAERIALEHCDVRSLDVTGAKLGDVGLRGLDLAPIAGLEGLKGATMDGMQVALLATSFATHFGIRVVE
ncbi:pentapeptide repeat-containing protein [Agromyces laixinhei]|uniref:pentapeptide repeat-containing protein n=1 Tax=Agromyces laixinhei TaxID=2585717 RepID=UPI0012EE4A47|nr:pentapeptide repeat-containing protein [Agromyces laixinhei]